MIDKGQTGKLALFTKVRITATDATQDPTSKGLGEIEIQFAPPPGIETPEKPRNFAIPRR